MNESDSDDEPVGNGPVVTFSVRDSRELMAADPVGDRIGRRHFDHRVAIHEAGHVVSGYVLLSVAGSTIEFVDGHHGLTWSNDAALEPDADTVESICAQLAPLMPGVLDEELEQAHSHVVEWLAGIEAEKLFCDELLPNTGHDIDAARAVSELIVREISHVDAYIEFARNETRALLIAHAAKVLAVASALVDGIAGLMANVQDESNFDPKLRHPDQPHFGGEAHFAHGLYQEGGTEWNHYAAWLAKNYPGADWKDARLQSRFAAENLKKNYPSTWRKMNEGNRFQAGAAYVNEYLKPAASFRAGRINKYLRGGVGPLEQYTGPPERNLLANAAKVPGMGGGAQKIEGDASVRVAFENMPAGAKAYMQHGGMFKTGTVDWGTPMPSSNPGGN